MKWKFSITHKGILLVVVPLLFELGFVYKLTDLTRKAQAKAAQAEHLQDLSDTTNAIVRDLYNLWSTRSLGEMRDAGLLERYNPRPEEQVIFNEISHMLELTKDDPHQHEVAEQISQSYSRGVMAFDEGIQAYKHHDEERFNRIKKAMKVLIQNMASTEMLDLPREAKELQMQARKYEQEDRATVNQYIQGFVIFSIVATIFLAVFVSRGLTTRLAKLADNTSRLARGERLTGPLGGGDEIAEVDTAFHKMAESLAESRRRERAVLDNARDVICSIDKSGRLTAVNSAAARILGYEPEELLGSHYIDLVAKGDTVHVLDSVEEAVGSSAAKEFEARMVTKDNAVIDVLWSTYWSTREQTLFCVLHDISERKEAERMRQEVVAMVSHDLRSPLTAIKLVLEMLTEGAYGQLSADALKMVRKADVAGTRMMLLVNDLLDVEKIKSGMMTLQIRKVQTSDLFDVCSQTLSGLLQERSIGLMPQAPSIEILVDPDRMTQVLVNLVSNAIKFSPPNSQITLSAKPVHGGTEISVVDQGSGIPAHMLDKIFDRFQQVRDSDAKGKGGSGLGLAICKAIVELHGGRIWAESQNQNGSTFKILLKSQS